MNKRIIYCEDAIEWIKKNEIPPLSSFVVSLPDISEFHGYSLEQWEEWFVETASLILSRCPDQGVVIFYQSDIKFEGTWIDKGYLCQTAARKTQHKLLWHKILCRVSPGVATFGKPSYSHLLCFSKDLRLDIGRSTPDVVSDLGEKTWTRGMGLNACVLIAKFISEQTNSSLIINPFCGEGSMVATANAFKLDAIGIERSPKRALKARELKVFEGGTGWKFQMDEQFSQA